MHIFQKKAVKSPQRRRLRPRTPLASGGWGLRPQTPTLLLSPTAVFFRRGFTSTERTLLLRKINRSSTH